MVSFNQNIVANIFTFLGVLLLGIFLVSAYTPAQYGHTFRELQEPSGCQNGQVLQWNGTAWKCQSMLTWSVSPSNGGRIPKIELDWTPGEFLLRATSSMVDDQSDDLIRIGTGIISNDPGSSTALYVYNGDLKATGTICSDSGGCIDSSSQQAPPPLLYNRTYTGSLTGPVNMGPHEFCYLSKVSVGMNPPSAGTYTCSITLQGSNWILTFSSSVSSEKSCEAVCIDRI